MFSVITHPYKKILQNVNLKITPARVGVLDFLSRNQKPVDVETVVEFLDTEAIAADKATVYRILDTYLEKGIIRRFEFQEGKFRYELAGSDHHHLLCERCGRIEDISDCSIGDLEKEIMSKKKFLVKRHALEFFGVCLQCQQ